VNDIETTTGHVAIVVFVTGAAPGAALLVEYVMHMECVPKPNIGQFDALPSPHIPAALEQQRLVDVGMPTGYSEETFSRTLASSVRWAASMIGQAGMKATAAIVSNQMRQHYGRTRAPRTDFVGMIEPRGRNEDFELL